jgi:class 3 adenylate cyclase
VHGQVDRFSGATNKNMGDSFLCVWKFREEDIELSHEGSLHPRSDASEMSPMNQLADMAVISFIKTIACVKQSSKIEEYRNHRDLQKKMKNFSVNLGVGLHVGWAIEGAIGSHFKIDASYLSPNVNMASRLEGATKQFGVHMLLSGALYKLLTPVCQKYMRHIDTVVVKGSSEPVALYTCDMDTSRLVPRRGSKDASLINESSQTERVKKLYKKRVKHRMKRNRFRERVLAHEIEVAEYFKIDGSIQKMCSKQDNYLFRELFRTGLRFYVQGNWPKARQLLEEALAKEQDHPTKCLLDFMEERDFKAPKNWKGYRNLTEK